MLSHLGSRSRSRTDSTRVNSTSPLPEGPLWNKTGVGRRSRTLTETSRSPGYSRVPFLLGVTYVIHPRKRQWILNWSGQRESNSSALLGRQVYHQNFLTRRDPWARPTDQKITPELLKSSPATVLLEGCFGASGEHRRHGNRCLDYKPLSSSRYAFGVATENPRQLWPQDCKIVRVDLNIPLTLRPFFGDVKGFGDLFHVDASTVAPVQLSDCCASP